MPSKTHDQVLADLDARDERLNGHGVRPSEMCGTVAGGGPYPGSRCTFRKHENDAPHSWESPEARSLARLTDESPAEQQPALPGTPEPETDDYSIPYEAQFNHADYQSAPGIKAIAERLVAQTSEFAHLRDIPIRYFWKRRGGLKGGNPRLGSLQKPSGIVAYSLGYPTLWLWLAADHCRDAKLSTEQLDALIFTQLCKAAVDPDDHSAYRVLGPDFEGYTLAIQRYGLGWLPDLRELGANIKQLDLLDGIELPALDDGDQDDSDDEGDA